MGRWPNKLVIGLTGNIATGKSIVRKMLEHGAFGISAFGIDADGLAHQAMSPRAPAYKPVVQAFGKFILGPDGQIDRQKLGQVVFSNPAALEQLESIVHPIVYRAIDTLIKRSKKRLIVVEAIKLLEGPLAEWCNAIWVVDSTEKNQIIRLVQKRGMTPEGAQQRVKAQSPQADKIAKADTVITNNGDLEALWGQVKGALKALVSGGAVQEEPEQVTRVKVEKRPTPQAASSQQQPAAAPQAEAMDVEEVEVTRGKPANAEAIGQMLSQFVGHEVSRTDVMMAFGEKAYLLAESEGTQLGLVGMLVENLITRVDEFYITPGAPTFSVAQALIESIEQNSKDLQSEVGFIFLPEDTPQETRAALESKGYEQFTAQTIKVPAWREAIQDSQPPGTHIFGKKLRDDLVLKPL